ncbi:MAG: NAD(P)/FAD-dependent oxidoreductase [Gammaproteobacteria bacterium]|nr:NAD(P)/FAD-dependent oxidoreductase [Gammaproteobacteria bacterium]
MMDAKYDAIVIGAGHNGLVCAAYLAKAGRRVLLAEASAVVGGAAITLELIPGFKVSTCAHLANMLHPKVVRELDLNRHGLEWAKSALPTTVLAEDGQHLTTSQNTVTGIASGADSDLQYFPKFNQRLSSYASIIKSFLDKTPPRLGTADWSDRSNLLKLGWAARRLGRDDMREFLRIVGMNIADLLEEFFDSELLRGALAWDAVVGSNLGPRSPGSVLTYLYRLASQSERGLAYPKGGLGAVTAALAAAARSSGAEIRAGSPVAKVLLQSDKVGGIRLESGEEVAAPVVISGADPRRSFLRFVGSENLDTGFVRRVRNIRMKGVTAKVNFALSALPAFSGLDAERTGGRLLIAPGIDYLERAFNHSKYGEYSESPGMEIVIPSVHDNTLAPNGKHVMSVIVQYAPYDLRDDWDQSREQFTDCVIQCISRYARGFSDSIEACEVITPLDLERDFRMSGGHWHHGEIAFDQFMMMRPMPGVSQYYTPVPGFYLCSAGCHPGGGVMGAAGMNAARQVLATEVNA